MAKYPAKCPRCGNRLESDAAADQHIVCAHCQTLLSLPGKTRPSDKPDPLLGQTLGEFEIIELLGRGGMGAVYKAKQPALGRFVAVKVIPCTTLRDPAFIERFNREARAAAAVSHPNIVQVHAVGADRGYQYIAMELVKGESLADALRREGRIDPERAVAILKQVVAALAKAHAAGIVHRDIKPANILLTPNGLVKVADFGLAKRAAVDVTLTQAGQVLGTPLYLPPEAGQGKPMDARSDLYSLGATFFHLLAGRPVFTGFNAAVLIVQHATEPAPPLRSVVADIGPRLAHIVDRLLRKNPAGRYPSAQALLTDLETLSPRGPAATTATGPAPMASDERLASTAPRWRPSRVAVASAAAVTLASIALVVLLATRPGRPRATPPTPAVPSPPPNAKEAGPQADRILAELRSKSDALTKNDRFGEALSQIDAFEKGPRPPDVTSEARKLRSKLLDMANARYDSIVRDADAAVARGDAAAARAALSRVMGVFGIPELAGKARTKLAGIDASPGQPWVSLFDGKTLGSWRAVEDFGPLGKGGQVKAESGEIVLEAGEMWTAAAWTGPFPKGEYEVTLELNRLGKCCQVIFPIGAAQCSLELGSVEDRSRVSLSNVDGRGTDGIEGKRTSIFETDFWIPVRLRVAAGKIQAWLGETPVADLPMANHSFSVKRELEPVRPFGIAAWQHRALLRNIRVRNLGDQPPVEPSTPVELFKYTVTTRDLSKLHLIQDARLRDIALRDIAVATLDPSLLVYISTPSLRDLGLYRIGFVARNPYMDQFIKVDQVRKAIAGKVPKPPGATVLGVETTPVAGEIYVDGISVGAGYYGGAATPGKHIVSFGAVRWPDLADGPYASPPPEEFTIAQGQEVRITGIYTRGSDVGPFSAARAELHARLKAANPEYNGRARLQARGRELIVQSVRQCNLHDLSPLRGMALIDLDCSANQIRDLSPLAGMPLRSLNCTQNQIADLTPLKGLPLEMLKCAGNKISDLTPLKGMALTDLNCSDNQIRELSPLAGMPLKSLACDRNQIADLTPLKGLPLQMLRCAGNQISDLAPLKGMALVSLGCMGNQIRDLSPLAGMPLKSLHCTTNQIADLTPLKGLPLQMLSCVGNKINDLTPLKGMALTDLNCSDNQIRELSPLAGMPLRSLECARNQIVDLTPLKGLPLQRLECGSNKISDLSPLKEIVMLGSLDCSSNPIADLSPLKDSKLRFLNCSNTRVSDLSPLRGTWIRELGICGLALTDIAVLRDLPLEGLAFSPSKLTCDLDFLRHHKTVKFIDADCTDMDRRTPAEQFWSEWDAKKGRK